MGRAPGCVTTAGASLCQPVLSYLYCLVSTYVVEYQRRIFAMHRGEAVDVDKLRELRIDQGLSQRRLSELAGISNTSVWKIERGGGANPPVER